MLPGLLVLTACASTGEAPRPGWSSGPPPSLEGLRVMALPLQGSDGIPPGLDAELRFALESRGSGATWVLPDEIRRSLERSPTLAVEPDRLAAGVFRRTEVRRIGDPLYGQLRRLGELVDAPLALLPVHAAARPDRPGPPPVAAGVELLAALVDIRSGRVLWTGVVEGLGPPGEAATLARAADALARTLAGGSG